MPVATSIPALFASTPETLPFDTSLHIRAFVLQRGERGNLLLYSTSRLSEDAAAIEALGGVARRYLNHGHEASFASAALRPPLFVHADERPAVEPLLPVRATFSRRHMLDDDFEVIPAPGHTAGATTYLWDSGSHRLLFPGDTIYLSDGEWVGAVFGDADRRQYIETLRMLAELDFDVLVPWAATAGQPYCAHTDPDDRRRRIDAIVERVRRGGDG